MSWNKRMAATRRKKRRERIGLGLCGNCGAETNEYSFCVACREKNIKRIKENRRKLKEKNLCQECGKVKVKKNQYYCDACKAKHYGKRICQEERCNNTPKRNHDFCNDCLNLRRFGTKVSNVYFINCSVCGILFTSKWERAKHCSEKCKKNAYPYQVVVKNNDAVCQECGHIFKVSDKNLNQKYCSDRCSTKSKHRNYRHKRRLRMKRQFIEIVNIGVLFKRDAGHCKICGKKLNRKRIVPHPMAVTIDHIIPLSKGGEHSYQNTQLACFMCNSIKGNGKIEGGEQLRMF